MYKENREYAWKYFSLHSDQRLKTFHFFVILSALISGATLTISKDVSNIIYAAPMAYLLFFLAFIFWKLDQRNKELIKHGEEALKALEQINDPKNPENNSIKLFTEEEINTSEKRRFPLAPLITAHFSYTNCFNWVFFVFGCAGFTVGTLIVLSQNIN